MEEQICDLTPQGEIQTKFSAIFWKADRLEDAEFMEEIQNLVESSGMNIKKLTEILKTINGND